MKRCERCEGRDVLMVGRRCHNEMTKKGGGGDLQGEKKKLYSQERKTENKKEVMDTIESQSQYATTTFHFILRRKQVTRRRPGRVCTVPSQQLCTRGIEPTAKRGTAELYRAIKVGQPWERRLTVPCREVPPFSYGTEANSSSQSLKLARC